MKPDTKKLLDALLNFDGKALSLLGEARAKYGGDPHYLDALIEFSLVSDGHVSSGATWLMKHHLEKGGTLSNAQADRFIAVHDQLVDWQAKLHFCQSLQFLALEGRAHPGLVDWLNDHLSHEKPFLRAWSLDGLVRVALAEPQYFDRAMNALKVASEDPAASVQARARGLLKLCAKET